MKPIWLAASRSCRFNAGPPSGLFDRRPVSASWAPDLLEEVSAYQSRLGLRRKIPESACTVITGQQPALFTGPMYTVYKAITSIQAAQRIEEAWGTPCVPIFWCGSDDHDLEEARTAHVLTKQHEALALRYAPDQEGRLEAFPLYRAPLYPELHQVIDTLAAAAPGSEYAAETSALLHETLDAASSLADWTVRILAALFQHTPLLFFEPRIPAARRLAAGILEQEIRHPLESTRLLNQAGQDLEALGFSVQVRKGENECNFFLEMGERRRKVVFEEGRFYLPEEDITCTQEEMLALLEGAPHRFSPNVALRCMVQQAAFPGVAAYVAGPGEIAYWAQLKPLFDFFGQPMPVVYPRAQCVLGSTKVNALKDRFGFTLADFDAPEEALVERALKTVAGSPALSTVRAGRGPVEGVTGHLVQAVASASRNPEVRESIEGWARRTLEGLDRVEHALLRQDAAKVEAVRQQVRRLCRTLAPGRKPQERVYSVVSFLFAHGGELIPKLMDAIDSTSFNINEVEL